MSWAERVKAGDEIVCICNVALNGTDVPLKIDRIYVIETVSIFEQSKAAVPVYFTLRNWRGGHRQAWFNCWYFKPVSKRGTAKGVAILRGLLTPAKQEVDA